MTRYAAALSVLVGAALGLLLTFAPDAHAAPTGTTCTGALCQVDATGDLRVNDGANTAVDQSDPCFMTTTVTSITATEGRKGIALLNKGSTTVYLSFDADSPTSVGVGWPLAAGDFQYFPHGDQIPVKGVAQTTTQTAPNCVEILQLK
jgi:hypothetical protein